MKKTTRHFIRFIGAACALVAVAGCETDNTGGERDPYAGYPPLDGGAATGQNDAENFGTGLAPASAQAIVDDPSNSRFRYRDLHGSYVVTLMSGGRFRQTSTRPGVPDPANPTAPPADVTETTDGNWSWSKSGPTEGVLNVGGQRWDLYFAKPDVSSAQTEGDVRTYTFQWERMY